MCSTHRKLLNISSLLYFNHTYKLITLLLQRVAFKNKGIWHVSFKPPCCRKIHHAKLSCNLSFHCNLAFIMIGLSSRSRKHAMVRATVCTSSTTCVSKQLFNYKNYRKSHAEPTARNHLYLLSSTNTIFNHTFLQLLKMVGVEAIFAHSGCILTRDFWYETNTIVLWKRYLKLGF